ncbi:MAG: hypothetical protein AB7R89_26705 [Dehalococcoidia bacterium]
MVARLALPGLAVLLTIAIAFTPIPPAALAQPDCDTLQPGVWSGHFEAQWTLRWTAELGNQPVSRDTAPAVWESTRSVRGDIDLHVPEPGTDGTPTVIGVVRATYRTETMATREDGARQSRHEIGLLSGGAPVLPADRPLVAGNAIIWMGAWWTRPAGIADAMFSSTFVSQSADGRTLYGDGHVVARPADPIALTVESVDCRKVTGTVDPAVFGLPQLPPDAGLTVTVTTATLTLNHIPPLMAPARAAGRIDDAGISRN